MYYFNQKIIADNLQSWQILYRNYVGIIWRQCGAYICAGAITAILAYADGARCQDVTAVIYPETYKSIDDNGVDLVSGKLSVPISYLSVGSSASGLSRAQFGSSYTDSNLLRLQITYGYPGGDPVHQDKQFIFQVSGNGWSSTFEGESSVGRLSVSDASILAVEGNSLKYVSSGGDIILFRPDTCGLAYCEAVGTRKIRPISWTKPDGELLIYDNQSLSVSSSAGWLLKYDSGSSDYPNRVTAINAAVEPNYCAMGPSSCQYSYQWPFVQGGRFSAVDALSRAYVVNNTVSQISHTCNNDGGTANETLGQYVFVTPSGVTRIYNYDLADRVRSVVTPEGTWSYRYSDSTGEAINCGGKRSFDADNDHTVIVTNPYGSVMSIRSSTKYGQIRSVTDWIGRNTTYAYLYDTVKPKRIDYPNRSYAVFDYDGRGNVISSTIYPEPGSDIQPIIVSAGYDAVCNSSAKCNKPNWIVDQRGGRTDYVYDSQTGLTISVTSPPDETGVRPVVVNQYGLIATYGRSSDGTLAQVGSIWRPTAQFSCQRTAGAIDFAGMNSTLTCAGGAGDLVTVTTSYAGSKNALPTSVVRTAGGVSLAQTVTYDSVGNVLTVDGPLAGAADTVRNYYDAMRQLTGVIGPDPDGSGPASRSATRTTYDSDGRVILVEQGTAQNQGDMGMATFVPQAFTRHTYGSSGRLVKTEEGQP